MNYFVNATFIYCVAVCFSWGLVLPLLSLGVGNSDPQGSGPSAGSTLQNPSLLMPPPNPNGGGGSTSGRNLPSRIGALGVPLGRQAPPVKVFMNYNTYTECLIEMSNNATRLTNTQFQLSEIAFEISTREDQVLWQQRTNVVLGALEVLDQTISSRITTLNQFPYNPCREKLKTQLKGLQKDPMIWASEYLRLSRQIAIQVRNAELAEANERAKPLPKCRKLTPGSHRILGFKPSPGQGSNPGNCAD